MANMASKVRFLPDGELYLEPEGSAANTSDGDNASTNVLSLDALTSYWDSGELAMSQQIAISINVTAIDFSDGDETYDFELEVDSEEAFGDSPVVVQEFSCGAVGNYVMMVSREQILEKDSDATHLRLVARIDDGAANSASITYNAYVGPVVGK